MSSSNTISFKKKKDILSTLLLSNSKTCILALALEGRPSFRKVLMKMYNFETIPSASFFDSLKLSNRKFIRYYDDLKKLIEDEEFFLSVVIELFPDFGYKVPLEKTKDFEIFIREKIKGNHLVWKTIYDIFQKGLIEECKSLFYTFLEKDRAENSREEIKLLETTKGNDSEKVVTNTPRECEENNPSLENFTDTQIQLASNQILELSHDETENYEKDPLEKQSLISPLLELLIRTSLHISSQQVMTFGIDVQTINHYSEQVNKALASFRGDLAKNYQQLNSNIKDLKVENLDLRQENQKLNQTIQDKEKEILELRTNLNKYCPSE